MSFKVILTERAIKDVEDAVNYIWAESPHVARSWLLEFWDTADRLKEMPLRHAVIPEATASGFPHRSIRVHSHRLIYRIDEPQATVYIVRVYHGARRSLGSEDF